MTAGHQLINGKGNGAFGVGGFDEAKEARIFVNDVIHWMIYGNKVPESKILTDHDSWSLSSVIDWVGKKLTRNCLTIDFHFDSFTNKNISGTSVFVANDRTIEEFKIAKHITDNYAQIMGIQNRGVKTEAESGRRYLGMLSNSKLAHGRNFLVEICFISNADDIKAYSNKYPELVKFTANYLTELLNV